MGLTPEDRFRRFIGSAQYTTELKEAFLHEINEAEHEAYDCGFRSGDECTAKSIQKAYREAFESCRDKAAEIVLQRRNQADIAAQLYTLPENKLMRKVEAWIWDLAESIRRMELL